MNLPIEQATGTTEDMPEAPIEPKTYTGTMMTENDVLASQKTINKIIAGQNVPRRKGFILEKGPYESIWVVWMSPNKNRAERRARRSSTRLIVA